MSSLVACKNISRPGREAVLSAVAEAMRLAGFHNRSARRSVFIKVNSMSTQVVPGTCTSPWVFEGVVKVLREALPGVEIFFGDADAYGIQRAEESARNWGLIEVAKRYDARFVNLSEQPSQVVNLGETLGSVDLPSLLLDVDTLITIPVIKTHYLTVMTGALKNQWGLLPNVRYRFHPVFASAISEINNFFSRKLFVVADMTIGQHGLGPRMGEPIVMDMVLASEDPVASDTAAFSFAGVDVSKISYLPAATQARAGSMEYRMVGDEPHRFHFSLAKTNRSLLLHARETLKDIPLLKYVLLNPIVYALQAKMGKQYVERWYHTKGLGYLRQYASEGHYAEEFKALLKQ